MVCNEHVLNMLMNMNSSALSSGVPFQTQECLPIEGSCDVLWQLLGGLLCQSTRLASISKSNSQTCGSQKWGHYQSVFWSCTGRDPIQTKHIWRSMSWEGLLTGGMAFEHPKQWHSPPSPATYAALNLSFKLCSKNWGLSWWGLLFNRKVITLLMLATQFL